jgi:hypothetical protein
MSEINRARTPSGLNEVLNEAKREKENCTVSAVRV